MRIFARAFVWGLPAAAAILVLCASTYKLSEAPAIWYDEGFYSQAAMNLAHYGKQELQVAPGTFVSTAYVTVGYPLLYPVSVSYKLFGTGVVQGRAVMVLFIIAFVVTAYFFIYLLFGSWFAAWSSFLLASFPILYGDGKSILGEVPGMVFLLWCLIALVYLERSSYKSMRAYVCAGLTAGLCVATKPIFILLVPALALAWLVCRRSVDVRWGGFTASCLAFIVPVLLWIDLQFGAGATLSSVLAYYVGSPYAVDNHLALAVQNFLRFFTETTPMYTMATMLIWLGSLALRKKKGIAVTAAEITALFFCAAVLVAYLRIQGWYRYFFPAEILALLLVPFALVSAFEYLRGKVPFLKKFLWLPYAVVALLVAVQLYQLARTSYVAGYYHSTNTHDWQAALAGLPKDASIFLCDAPELAVLLPSANYYQYLDPTSNVRLGAEEVPLLESGTAEYVVVSLDTYAAHPELFAQYQLLRVVGRYDFLKKA